MKAWPALGWMLFPLWVWGQEKRVTLSNVVAHWYERVQIHAGLAMSKVGVFNVATGRRHWGNDPFTPSLTVGACYVFFHYRDFVGLGVNPNLVLGLTFNPREYLLVQPSLLLLGRVGAFSTNFNRQRIGAGLGIGFNYIYHRRPYLDRFRRERVMAQSVAAPVLLAEVTARLGTVPISLRFFANLTPFYGKLDVGNEHLSLKFVNYGFSLAWHYFIRYQGND